jgi:glutamyl-Q tRNA(Asp) synthetase
VTTRPYRGRFAPSPTGPLHFGSLLTAFASWVRARQQHGAWLIRIEDLDPPREVAGAAEQQLRTLAAFGFVSDEPVWRQSERSSHYDRELQRLCASDLAFTCFCSRSDLAEQNGIHRGCVTRATRRSPAIRARVPDTDVGFDDALQGRYSQRLASEVGDFVLQRVEGWHAYQLAVVVDDAAQGITDIVRGSDLLDSTPRQLWLQQVLGYATPTYLHLPLALDAEGRKLGKSLAALPLDESDPLPALQAAWAFLGQEPSLVEPCRNRAEFLSRAIEHFAFARVPREARPVPVAKPV